jgi:hypothetical protein
MSNGGDMSTTQYLLFVSPFVLTILVVFGMKYFSAPFQARAKIANDARYQALAEKAVAGQSELAAIRAELAKVAVSLAAVEKILHQVD